MLSLDGLDMLVLTWGFALAAGGAKALTKNTSLSALLYFGAYLLFGFFLLAMYIAVCQVLSKERSRGWQVSKVLLALVALTIIAVNRYT